MPIYSFTKRCVTINATRCSCQSDQHPIFIPEEFQLQADESENSTVSRNPGGTQHHGQESEWKRGSGSLYARNMPGFQNISKGSLVNLSCDEVKWKSLSLQRIFPTQESNQGLLLCRQILYQLSYQERSSGAVSWWSNIKKHVFTVHIHNVLNLPIYPCNGED